MDGRKVETDIIVETVDVVSIVQFKLETFVYHLSYVDSRIVDTCRRRHDFFNQ